ncbi:putative zinc-type alcohol dehydrogenase-like protein [Halenospora varia]|nr:putative zinc-type alcohol dehydrogenase-like protein [Halenospora varia]
MSTQTVYRLQDQKSHHSIKRFQEPIPSIDKHEVLIKIHGISLNYRDVAVANGTYPFPVKDQVVPCSDDAGEIVKIGSSIDDLKVGARVVGNFNLNNLYGPLTNWNHGLGAPIDGVLREYIALPRSDVVEIPLDAKLSYTQMAALVCTGTRGVSISGLQLAHAAGATTIVTSSSDEKLKLVQEKYHADHVINYKATPNWSAEVLKPTNGKGVDYILENGGSGTIKQSIDAVAMGGSISIIGFLSQAKQDDMPDVAMLALGKGCIIRGINVGSKQLLEELVRFVAAKEIRPPVEKVFGFGREEVVAAYEYLKKGSHIGKVCISVE